MTRGLSLLPQRLQYLGGLYPGTVSLNKLFFSFKLVLSGDCYSTKKTMKCILKKTEAETQRISSHLKERIKFMNTDPFPVLNGTGFGTFPDGKRHSRWQGQPWGPSLLLLIQSVHPFNSTSQAFIMIQPRAARI